MHEYRGSTYFEEVKISELFLTELENCVVETISFSQDTKETPLDDKTGLKIISYDKKKDYLLIDRTI